MWPGWAGAVASEGDGRLGGLEVGATFLPRLQELGVLGGFRGILRRRGERPVGDGRRGMQGGCGYDQRRPAVCLHSDGWRRPGRGLRPWQRTAREEAWQGCPGDQMMATSMERSHRAGRLRVARSCRRGRRSEGRVTRFFDRRKRTWEARRRDRLRGRATYDENRRRGRGIGQTDDNVQKNDPLVPSNNVECKGYLKMTPLSS